MQFWKNTDNLLICILFNYLFGSNDEMTNMDINIMIYNFNLLQNLNQVLDEKRICNQSMSSFVTNNDFIFTL